jgi:hypothetical protein
MYQMAIKYTLWLKIDKLALKILTLQGLLKFTQVGIFSLKIYHLATLLSSGIPLIPLDSSLHTVVRARFIKTKLS